MAAIPGDVEPAAGPPLSIPLSHFLVGLALLVVGVAVGVWTVLAGAGAGAGLVHVHLLLVGWVCVTIMGAMTQFVPVWAGVELASRRLARWQLRLVTAGLAGFVPALWLGRWSLVAGAGAVVLAGIWVFVANIGRTLVRARPLDGTGRHFAAALSCFLAVTVLGLALAVDLAGPFLGRLGLSHARVLTAHATLAVFGAVLLTVVGALAQLAPMFTGTEPHGIDGYLRTGAEWALLPGVALLALGRLLGLRAVALLGGVLVPLALLAVAVLLARRLLGASVERTPVLTRYLVVAVSLAGWAVWTLPAWIRAPLDPSTVLGPPGAVHLLAVGAVGFVLTGTLYHAVPFLIWVRRYADLVGLEDVPMVEDLYDDRLAAGEFWTLAPGGGSLVLGQALGLPDTTDLVAGVLALCGAGLFALNLALTVHRHGPDSAPDSGTAEDLHSGSGTENR